VDRTATVDFLGWVIAACSLGCSIANPLFGLWNQKTMSIKAPVVVGMIMMIIGQSIFGLLPLFSSNQKWIMLFARLMTGFGAGTLSVLRAYAATASIPRERLSSVSYGTAGYAVFTPVGENGFRIGRIIFNMYTLPAFFMVLLSIACCLIIKLLFKEEYAGIIDKNQEDSHAFVVIPKFDVIPAVICIYLWMVSCMVATNIEVLVASLPVTVHIHIPPPHATRLFIPIESSAQVSIVSTSPALCSPFLPIAILKKVCDSLSQFSYWRLPRPSVHVRFHESRANSTTFSSDDMVPGFRRLGPL
ncbi:hypothetical protein COOONC_06541, partial [Cooperia oncophora]